MIEICICFDLTYLQAEGLGDNGRSPYITATAVTTRTATTHEDLETNAKTSQVRA